MVSNRLLVQRYFGCSSRSRVVYSSVTRLVQSSCSSLSFLSRQVPFHSFSGSFAFASSSIESVPHCIGFQASSLWQTFDIPGLILASGAVMPVQLTFGLQAALSSRFIELVYRHRCHNDCVLHKWDSAVEPVIVSTLFMHKQKGS